MGLFDDVPKSNYSKESSLKKLANVDGIDDEYSQAGFEPTASEDENQSGLDDALKNAKDPKVKAILLNEKNSKNLFDDIPKSQEKTQVSGNLFDDVPTGKSVEAVEDYTDAIKKNLGSKSFPSVEDFNLRKAAGSALDVPVGLADMVPQVAGFAGGAVAAAGSVPYALATGKPVGETAQKAMNAVAGYGPLQPETEAGKKLTAGFGVAIDEAKGALQQGAENLGNIFDLPTEDKALLHAGGTAIPDIAMAMSMGAGGEAARATKATKKTIVDPKSTAPGADVNALLDSVPKYPEGELPLQGGQEASGPRPQTGSDEINPAQVERLRQRQGELDLNEPNTPSVASVDSSQRGGPRSDAGPKQYSLGEKISLDGNEGLVLSKGSNNTYIVQPKDPSKPLIFDVTAEDINNGSKTSAPLGQTRFGKSQRGAIDPDILDAIPRFGKYIVNTLMRLPNKQFITKDQIMSVLGQQDITAKEKQLILDSLGDKDGMPAKEFAEKVAENLIPLQINKTDTYADYGLHNIGDPQVSYHVSGMNPDNGNTVNVVHGFTRDEAEAIAQDRTERTGVYHWSHGEETAQTHLWDLPEPMLHDLSNHFNDPNYFAHTRVFDRGDVRHIIELQSDTMQHTGKPLTSDEIAHITRKVEDVRQEVDAFRRLSNSINEGYFGQAADHWKYTLSDKAKADVLSRYTARTKAVGNRFSREAADQNRLIEGLEKNHGTSISEALQDADMHHSIYQEYQGRELELEDLHMMLNKGKTGELLKQFNGDYWKRIIREEVHQAHTEGKTKIRFGDADTIAKVEAWPRHDVTTHHPNNTATIEATGKFVYPEHQSIYDRYKKEIIPWIQKEYGAKQVEVNGHKYWEFPTEPKVQAFGNRSKSNLGGVGKKQGGAIDFGAIFDAVLRRKEKNSSNDDIARAVKIALNSNPKSAVELKAWLNIAKVDSKARQALMDRSDEIFKNKQSYSDAFKDEGYGGTGMGKLMTRTDMPTSKAINAMRDASENYPKGDINERGFTLTTSAWNTLIKQLGRDNPLVDAVKIARDKLQDIIEVGNMISNDAKPFFDNYKKLTKDWMHLSKADRQAQRLAVQKAFNFFEKADNVKQWFNGKDYYPNKQQLLDHGLTDKQADAYLSISKAMEQFWDLLEMTNKMLGREPLRRIPGYVPHVWRGGYRFYVEHSDDAGKTWHIAEMKTYMTLKKAQTALATYKEGLQGRTDARIKKDVLQDEIERPSPMTHKVGDYAKEIGAVLDIIAGKDNASMAGLHKLLSQLDERSTEGILKQAMERELNMTGHMSDIVAKGEQQLSGKDLDLAVNLQQRIFSSGVKFYQNAKAAREVWQPMYDSGLFNKKPRLQEVVRTMVDTFQGKDKTYFEKATGHVVEQYFIDKGMNPATGRQISQFLTGAFSKMVLWGNPGFYVQNIFQPLWTVSSLLRMHALSQHVGDSGSKYSYIIKALAKTTLDLPGIYGPEILARQNPVLRAAFEMGKEEPVLNEHMNPGKMGDAVARQIERAGRRMSFAAGYHYFSNFMEHGRALQAASDFADQVMVPYDRSLGRPIAANRAGDLPSLFVTYMSHQMGQMATDIKLIANNPAKISAYLPVATTIMLGWALTGNSGVPGSANYDQLVYWLNKVPGWENKFPTMKEVARMMPEGVSGMGEFGALGLLTGGDWSNAGNNLNISFALPGVAKQIGNVMLAAIYASEYGLSQFTDIPAPSRPQWNEIVSGLPSYPGIKIALEQAVQATDLKDFGKRINPLDSTPTSKTVGTTDQKDFDRTSGESTFRALTGRRSLREASRVTDEQIFKKQLAGEHAQQNQGVQHLIDDRNHPGHLTSAQEENIRSMLKDQLDLEPHRLLSLLQQGDKAHEKEWLDRIYNNLNASNTAKSRHIKQLLDEILNKDKYIQR